MASGSNSIPRRQDQTVGFIDCGDLGQAILKGIRRLSLSAPQDPNSWAKATYIVSVPSEKSAQKLRQAFAADPGTQGFINLEVLQNQNVQVANRSQIVILASPEGTAEGILKGPGMTDALAGKFLISIPSGPTAAANGKCIILRAALNEAASCGASATIISTCPASNVGDGPHELVDSFFKSIGLTVNIAESEIDAASVICQGSAAFMALFCDAIVDGAVAGGLPRHTAEAMVPVAVGSFCSLLWNYKGLGLKRPSEVREMICAHPGTTIEGILDLENGGIRGLISGVVRDAMLAARLPEKDDG